MLLGLLALVALIIDLGDSRQLTRENQSASDMAVLAAASDLPSSAGDTAQQAIAHATAADYLERNLGLTVAPAACRTATTSMQCYSVDDVYAEVTTPYSGVTGVAAHHQIHVTVCSRSDGFFAPAIGAAPSEVCRSATAILDEHLLIVPAVLALDPTGPEAFHLEGSAQAVGVGGSLVSNSTSSSAFHMKDSTAATASGADACICAVGSPLINGGAVASPAAGGGIAAIDDPWATLVEPTGFTAGSYNAGTKTFSPGSFGSITIDKPGTYTFLPGFYEFTGNFKIEGAGVSIVAENVLWYFGAGGQANWGSGPNTIRISARPANEYYGGNNGEFPPVAIFQSRSNPNDFHIGDDIRLGNVSGGACTVDSSAGISGGVYLPNASLMVRGNGGSGLCTDGAPVVAYRVQIQETGFVQGTVTGVGGTSTRATFLAE